MKASTCFVAISFAMWPCVMCGKATGQWCDGCEEMAFALDGRGKSLCTSCESTWGICPDCQGQEPELHDTVEFRGLADKKLNGYIGVVGGYEEDSDRYIVCVDFREEVNARMHSLKQRASRCSPVFSEELHSYTGKKKFRVKSKNMMVTTADEAKARMPGVMPLGRQVGSGG